MSGRHIILAGNNVIDIDGMIGDKERHFAAGPENSVNDRFALELAIDSMSRSAKDAGGDSRFRTGEIVQISGHRVALHELPAETIRSVTLLGEGSRARILDEETVDTAEGTWWHVEHLSTGLAGWLLEEQLARVQPIVTAKDMFFEPNALVISPYTEVMIELNNEGLAAHNFSIDALDISVDLAPGAEPQTVVINTVVGEYEYYCNIPGHRQAGMVGTLIVG